MVNLSQQLQVGQKVNLIEREFGCHLTLLSGEQPGCYTVIELTPSHVVLEDAVAEAQVRIPAFLVTAITLPQMEPAVVPMPAAVPTPETVLPNVA